MDTPLDVLNEAIALAGSQAKFAAALQVSQPTVNGWKKAGRLPHERCAEVEALWGIRSERLRPDMQWNRDESTGLVVSYTVQLKPASTEAA